MVLAVVNMGCGIKKQGGLLVLASFMLFFGSLFGCEEKDKF